MAAAEDAATYIAGNPREELYLAATGEKYPVEVLLQQIGDAKARYSLAPLGIMRFANHLADVRVLKNRPARWQDVFFPEVADLPGN